MSRPPPAYKVYRERWFVMLCFLFLNLSNAFTWISFFPVAPIVANFFETTIAKVNWFSSVFFFIPMICFPITTYYSSKKGLRFLLLTGGTFNFLGSLLKCVGVSNIVQDVHTKYAICLSGQTIGAVAQTFCVYIPIKISATWFPSNERPMITTVLSNSYSFGLLVTQIIIPYVVEIPEDLPKVVFISTLFAAITLLLGIVCVRRAYPKTPPSASAENMKYLKTSYFEQFKSILSFNTVQVFFLIGYAMGSISGLVTLTEQIICNIGYSEMKASRCIVAMYFCGYCASFFITKFLKSKTSEEMNLILKPILALSAIFYVMVCEFMVVPGYEVMLILSFCLYGSVTIGLCPFMLEILLEISFPIEETISTGLAHFIGNPLGLIMTVSAPLLVRETEMSQLNVCNIKQAKSSSNYSVYLSLFMSIYTFIFCFNILFFKIVLKRSDFEARCNRRQSKFSDIS